MGCDCGCTDTSINCNCPPPISIEGASLSNIVSTTFAGVPIDISGVGYGTNVYTNSSSGNQFIIVDANVYITSDATHTLTTYFTLNGSVGEANATSDGILRYTSASVKLVASHFTAGVLLPAGQSIWFNMVSSDATARARWATANIYKYQY